jgi:hypothetical protein
MKTKFKSLIFIAASLLLSGFGLIGGSMPVAAAQANSVMTLTYEIQTDRQGNQSLVLLAKLNQESGYPLSQRSIAFFEKTDVFGNANVPIGTAVTSAVGIAPLKYATREAGPHTFTVVYGGDETTTSAVVTATLDLQNLPELASLAPPTGMEKIDYWAMLTAGLVVVIVWGLLVSVFFGTVKGIRAASNAQ